MKKILIIGLGLIGSSIALGIKRAHPDFEILGSDRENIQEIAQKRGIIDSKVSLVEGAQKADIIILAVPIITTLELLKKLATLNLKKGLLITDTGSTKSALLIADLGDQTWAYGTRILADHTDAEDSYDATNTDRGTIYWAGQPTMSDTHGQATYRSAADEFDKMIARNLSTPYFADFRRPYNDWQRFGGTVFKTDSSIVSTF